MIEPQSGKKTLVKDFSYGRSMQVGEVRSAKADDFEHFRRLAESVDGWNLHYDKQGTKVFCKVKDGSTIRLIKVKRIVVVKANFNRVTL